MKKKNFLYGIIIIACAFMLILFCCSSPKGDTIESREALLDKAIPRGNDWTIAKETVIDEHIICGAYSTNGQSTIAVFKPEANGKYSFSTSTNRDSDDIIIGGVIINGDWYDLIWFNGVRTEYAEVIYTIDGRERQALKYDTSNMEIICIKNPEKEYSMEVNYYDSEGNKYE